MDAWRYIYISLIIHRIHGAGIYANIKGVYSWDPWHTIYSSTMDPSWVIPIKFHEILILDGQSMIESYISRFWASYKFVYKAAVIPK